MTSAFREALRRWLPLGGLLLAAAFASSAFWQGLRPPLQDLPQHLAAARVLLDRAHPGFRFDEIFEVDWLRSQYLGTYVLIGAFFEPLRLLTNEPLLWACRAVLVLLAFAWPLSAELAFRKLARPAGLGVFSLAFFFNAHLILGFLNFLLGVVACFIGIGCLAAARARARAGERTLAYEASFGIAALCCFYFHVVPFGLLAGVLGLCVLGEPLLALGTRPLGLARPHWFRSESLRLGMAFIPALGAALAWSLTPAGLSAREAARGSGTRGSAVYASFASNRAELEGWLDDAFTSPWDTYWARLGLALLGAWLFLELGRALASRRAARRGPNMPVPAEEVAPDRLLIWALRAMVPLCLVLYFVLPASYDWIWPINARFPLLAVLFLPFWLPAAGAPASVALRAVRAALLGSLFVVAAAQASVARSAFTGFEREMRGFDELLAQIPPGSRTATLVFDRGSRHVRFAPFLHVGAYYQAERGGVSFFSFADFPQSPVRFRPESRPPRVGPRWEWMPEKVRDRDLDWFDFVITRGGPGRLATSKRFEPAGRFGAYRLFRKRASTEHP